jgi:thiamine kinase-like enzyme
MGAKARAQALDSIDPESGVPIATQTGRYLNYDTNIVGFDDDALKEMLTALYALKSDLKKANSQDLLHNDPMPPNIIFTTGEDDRIRARVVDFELAQNVTVLEPGE